MLAPSYRFAPMNQKKIDKDIKPISLMLDIYPMVQDENIDKNAIISLLTKPLLHASLPITSKVGKVQITTPYPYEKISPKPKTEKNNNNKDNSPNQMVVHLNLYQNKKPPRPYRKRTGKHALLKVGYHLQEISSMVWISNGFLQFLGQSRFCCSRF